MKKGMPRFEKVAHAYGIQGILIQNLRDLKLIHHKTLEPLVIDVKVFERENCYPMVAPGRSNSQMLGLN
jgi:acetolactate synthase-1/2/3 large subunit